MNGQRITSRTYITSSIILFAFLVFSVVAFFQEKQDRNGILIFIFVICLLLFCTISLLNFIDIFVTDDGKYLAGYFGKKMEVEKIIKIGKLPAFMRIGAASYAIAWLSFTGATGKKKIKFFMIASNGWYLVEDMKIKGFS